MSEQAVQQRKWLGKLAIWVVIIIVMVATISPVKREIKTYTLFAAIGILVIWGVALTKLKRWTFDLSRRGDFERALQVNRNLSRIPGYGKSLEGLILFQAGRYAEARTFLKPFAFDEQGKPRLTDTQFYVYAVALENDGKEPEAEELLKAAVQVPQQTAAFHVALATCLLSQKKDAKQACELMEQALATPDLQTTAYGRDSDHAMRLARYAWALAANGRKQDAEARLQEAFAGLTRLKEPEQAGLQYFAGEALRSLGEWRRARAAFDEAMRLSPDGPPATSSKKALAKMRIEAQG